MISKKEVLLKYWSGFAFMGVVCTIANVVYPSLNLGKCNLTFFGLAMLAFAISRLK